ncbi:hypothetical protein I862_04830 [endosymbiont of Acanthamoeba sp. UWC8]|uniref:hemolysin family protein n=1 Tax=endosymbiont of Acanthamoeba sp. UWC8 TaxID=86106 RepID=UPI0004D0EAC0|nr:hemolysin family protein [endosymbiont of Acanthamoeba sp. UWC8]AIF81524.1 hypothetical protein I862_04830 [endosymbiont of Acanthamoeba sp. UWC8]
MLSHFKEWFIIILIIGINSLFVLAEIAIITSRRTKLKKYADDGSLGANKALRLKDQPEAFLSTVQIGITLLSIIIGFYSGSELSGDLADKLKQYPIISTYAGVIANLLVVVVITYLTVLGEIIPKRIAMLYPEKLATYVSYLMLLFMKVFYPFIFLLSGSTKFALKLLKIKDRTSEITHEEIKMFVTQAENEGTVDKTEMDMIKRLIHLSDIKVGTIMTPRKKMVCLDLNDPEEINLEKLSKHPFNYFPVIDGKLENFIGLVSVKDLFNTQITDSILNLKSKSIDVLYIPEVATLTKLLESFKEHQSRVAMVLDEYGEIEGIVTLNDILKTFVGDLVTQDRGQTPSIIKKKDGSLNVNGNVPIEEIMELLQLSSLPGDKEEDYRTISSFILKQLNRMPEIGDSFEAGGYIYKVTKMDKFRIDRVSIKAVGTKS